MRDKINKIIDYFTNKDSWKFKRGGKYPVKLGDCLAKLDEIESEIAASEVLKILELWQLCGFTSSLQSIVKESGWKEHKQMNTEKEISEFEISERLANPEARTLFSFLDELTPDIVSVEKEKDTTI